MKSNQIRAGAAGEGEDPRIAEKIAWLETCDAALDPAGVAVLLEVFPALMRRHYDPVWRRIRRWSVPEDDVDDVLQNTFTQLFCRVRDQGAKSGFGPMLGKITKGKVIDYVRAQHRGPETVALSSGLPESEPNLARAIDYRELGRRFFPSLDPTLQAVVEKVFLADLTDAEAAQALGIPEGTVKSRRRAAMGILRALAALWQPPSQPSQPSSETPSGEIAA